MKRQMEIAARRDRKKEARKGKDWPHWFTKSTRLKVLYTDC
jgi:hypothetical protein